MSGVVLESIAQGVPVVATEVSGSEDIVEPGVGWVVPPDDPEALTRALSEAIAAGPDGLRRKGRAAHRLALERYHMARVAQQNLDWFEALLARPRQLGTGDPGQ